MLRMGDMPSEKRGKALETIERNAVIQAQLIDDLLDVSRIVSGKMKLAVAPIRPATTIDAALDVVRPSANARGVSLTVSLARDAGPIMADAARLQQIAWNLLENAVKFTPKGGRVGVTLEQRDSTLELRVSDSGIGIEPGFLGHVFERFTQADGSTRRTRGGLGLGLAIVKHLVELHGGEIRAESEGLGHGATFVVSLPLLAATRHYSFESPPASSCRCSSWRTTSILGTCSRLSSSTAGYG
jgi:signal transduction histidine kinase